MTCLFGHKWNRWEIGPTTVATGLKVLAQSRGCRRCGKVEMEVLMAEVPGRAGASRPVSSLDA